jgi:hypothetical protein
MSWRKRETMMLGEVPTRVITPPSSAPKDMGISSADTDVPARRATWKAIGRKSASAAMFFMKADSSATTVTSTATWAPVLLSRWDRGRIMASATPVRATPALITSAEATMMTMSSLKPRNASLIGTTPAATATTSPVMATRS